MARPKIPRNICGRPADSCFKPNARPMSQLEQVRLKDDEFEALRLVDLLGKALMMHLEDEGDTKHDHCHSNE